MIAVVSFGPPIAPAALNRPHPPTLCPPWRPHACTSTVTDRWIWTILSSCPSQRAVNSAAADKLTTSERSWTDDGADR